jgi:hypothetical protein
MHFTANAGLIFLTDELINDRYLVDTGATLSIVPCSQNSSPSGPLLTGADGQPIPSWGFHKVLNGIKYSENEITEKLTAPGLKYSLKGTV